MTLLCATVSATNITHANATLTAGFTAIGCPEDIHLGNDLSHNVLCLSTAEGTSSDGLIYGLPHYFEIFDLTPTTSGDPLTLG